MLLDALKQPHFYLSRIITYLPFQRKLEIPLLSVEHCHFPLRRRISRFYTGLLLSKRFWWLITLEPGWCEKVVRSFATKSWHDLISVLRVIVWIEKIFHWHFSNFKYIKHEKQIFRFIENQEFVMPWDVGDRCVIFAKVNFFVLRYFKFWRSISFSVKLNTPDRGIFHCLFFNFDYF